MHFLGRQDISQEQLECAFLLGDKSFVHRRADDPDRVTSYTAYFNTAGSAPGGGMGPRAGPAAAVLGSSLPGANSGEPKKGGTSSGAAGGREEAQVPQQRRTLLCSLRTHFVDMAESFNYTLAPAGYSAAPAACSAHSVTEHTS